MLFCSNSTDMNWLYLFISAPSVMTYAPGGESMSISLSISANVSISRKMCPFHTKCVHFMRNVCVPEIDHRVNVICCVVSRNWIQLCLSDKLGLSAKIY